MHVYLIDTINILDPIFVLLCYMSLRRYRNPIPAGSGWLHRFDGSCPFYVFPWSGDPRLSPEENDRRREEAKNAARHRRCTPRNIIIMRACWVVFEICIPIVAVVDVCIRLQQIMIDREKCKCETERRPHADEEVASLTLLSSRPRGALKVLS